jgi:hypothetical protein
MGINVRVYAKTGGGVLVAGWQFARNDDGSVDYDNQLDVTLSLSAAGAADLLKQLSEKVGTVTAECPRCSAYVETPAGG